MNKRCLGPQNFASALRHRQRGVAFYLFVVFALLTITALGGLSSGVLSGREDRAVKAKQTLEQARDLIMAQLTQPSLQGVTARLGQIIALPDLPIAPGPGTDAVEPTYDGLAETSGCAFRIWGSGQALRAPAISGASARCFGRLAWQELGLPLQNVTTADTAGEVPWLIVSPNLATAEICLPNLNPLLFAEGFAGYACPSPQPYPWLTVLDSRGNVLSDRVAFALIHPGPTLPGQVRSATAGPGAWLDSTQILATCATPCQPGLFDNAGYGHADNASWQLISAAGQGPLSQDATLYQTPHLFNDTVLFVTADELFARLEQRAMAAVTAELRRYQAAEGHMPFASALNSPNADCQSGLRLGHLASEPGDCGPGKALSLPAWLLAGGWERYFLYSVSGRCIASDPSCNAPGLVLDGRTDVDALLISPGAAIGQPPWASNTGAAQRPINATALSPNITDWLDTNENAAGTPDVFVTFENGTGTRNDRLYPVD